METPIGEKLTHLQMHEIGISRREIVGYFDVKSFKGWFNIFSYNVKGWIQVHNNAKPSKQGKIKIDDEE